MAEQNLPGTYENPYKFNAKELDVETGLYYYGARYFNPRISLWYGVDALAIYNPVMEDEFYGDGQHNGGVFFWGNLNPYIYTYQNPIKYIDPNGKQVIPTYGLEYSTAKTPEDFKRIENMKKAQAAGTIAGVTLWAGATAIAAYGWRAVGTFLFKEALESGFESITGIPVILNPFDIAERSVKGYFKDAAAKELKTFLKNNLNETAGTIIKRLTSSVNKHQKQIDMHKIWLKNPKSKISNWYDKIC